MNRAPARLAADAAVIRAHLTFEERLRERRVRRERENLQRAPHFDQRRNTFFLLHLS